jgi:hypothetical protein
MRRPKQRHRTRKPPDLPATPQLDSAPRPADSHTPARSPHPDISRKPAPSSGISPTDAAVVRTMSLPAWIALLEILREIGQLCEQSEAASAGPGPIDGHGTPLGRPSPS